MQVLNAYAANCQRMCPRIDRSNPRDNANYPSPGASPAWLGSVCPSSPRACLFATQPGAPLSAVAEHVGLTLPSMSTQVTGLVGRKLLHRATSRTDRRYITLTLTTTGAMVLAAARNGAQENLAQTLAGLTETERALVMQALQLLRTAFTPALTNDETKDNDEMKDNDGTKDNRHE